MTMTATDARSTPLPGDELGPAATRILDISADILSESGYDGFQLRDVAKQARVSLGTVYQHFPSHDDLVVSAVERWMARSGCRPPFAA